MMEVMSPRKHAPRMSAIDLVDGSVLEKTSAFIHGLFVMEKLTARQEEMKVLICALMNSAKVLFLVALREGGNVQMKPNV